MWRHRFALSLAEWRHHPWRHATALLAVALGVALASSVQTINESALAEFSQAVRSVNGQPDAVLAALDAQGVHDSLHALLATDEQVALVSPVLDVDTRARLAAEPGASAPHPPVGLRLRGQDALVAGQLAPDMLPQPAAGHAGSRWALLDPDRVFLNPAAQALLGAQAGQVLQLQSAQGWHAVTVAGTVAAGGAPLAVMDIAGVQHRFGREGRVSRFDIRLWPGTDHLAWQARITPHLPAGLRWAQADEASQRLGNLSRAYRVNLGVLALVALLVGGFLVYSVVSLSVAQRTPSLALLGVLGMSAAERRNLVLAEAAVVGVIGSVLGLMAGAGLAALALQVLGGDLGGGYFSGTAPRLAWPVPALLVCAVLGLLAAVVGAWWPARQAQALSPALALKGLGGHNQSQVPARPAGALLAAGGLLALMPPVGDLPLAAYASVAAWLAGGVVGVPVLVQALLARQPSPRQALALLALRRAHFARSTASATVAGVVASLALSVAITVMVASFREAVSQWLDTALPADLYVRSAGSASAPDQVLLPPGLIDAARQVPGVQRVTASRQVPLLMAPQRPALMLIARPLGPRPEQSLPLLDAPSPGPSSQPGRQALTTVYVSEPAAALYGWQVGQTITLPWPAGRQTAVQVGGVWRDYARQFGALVIDVADYQRLTGDTRVNDLAVWLQPGTPASAVEAALTAAAGADHPLEMAQTAALRSLSLKIFDRSFAVTVYLQAVAIAVGLVGVTASLSAQVLARRKEFGLLAHLGLTRRQVMVLVALETGTWMAAGVAIGLLLGLAMATVLVKVVNPQSFHWSMPLWLPTGRLAALAAAVWLAGVATACISARRAANQSAVMAVKEDW